MHLQQTANALGRCVREFITDSPDLQLPGVHANKSQLADKRVSHDLERQRREWFFVVGFARELFAGIWIKAMRFFGIEGGGR